MAGGKEVVDGSKKVVNYKYTNQNTNTQIIICAFVIRFVNL